jgi:hypothetical protein
MKIGETWFDVAKLTHKHVDGSLSCPFCTRGTLQMVEERPHSLYGTLGVMEIVLRCDAADCDRLVVV